METLLNLAHKNVRHLSGSLAVIMFSFGISAHISASPDDWMYYMEGEQISCMFSEKENMSMPFLNKAHTDVLALSCKPQVNVSLGTFGYAVLTSIMLVNAPAYPPFLYDVDIMGSLNDTAFCAQLGQELMVIVTELPTGNSCMSTVFIEDKLRPVLTCTPDTLPCNVDISSINFEVYLDEVTDNCDPDPDVFYSYLVQNLACNPNNFTQQILVFWTATDASGNSATCQDVIYLKKPSLSEIEFPDDTTVSCLNPDIDPSVTGEPTFNGEPLGMACQYMVFHSDQVVPMCNGAQKIIRLWTVMDWCTGAQRTDVQEILIIDNVPPVITCPANITVGTNPGVCTTKYTLPLPVVTDQCANPDMIDIDFFVSGIPGIFSPGDMVNLGLGTTAITVRATDPCGNSRQCQYTVTVKDFIPPIPICHSLTIGVGPDGTAILIADLLNFPIVENCGILSKQIWRMTDACNMPADLVPGPDVLFCCADVGDTLMVSFKVTDLSGNMNTCMFEVIVKDQIPPVAECRDITISITNQGEVIVTPDDIDDGSTDNCQIISRTVVPDTFDCDDIGVNVVILTVTDQSGNSATCTATVTIVDEVPPIAICQDVTVTLDSTGSVSITAGQINNGSSDNCVIDTMFLDIYDFNCEDEGLNIVILTVTDEAGNTATCTATVLVLSTPPVALCQDITVELDADGNVVITADQIDDGSFDDCGIDTITVDPSQFDCTDLGDNTVTLTVTDISGNSTTCTATVTVEDNMPPIALCQDITVMLDSMGMVTITTGQIDNGSSDNCLIDTIFLDVYDFDCSDIGDNEVTLTVTDNSGNSSTCTANVMVLMPDPPVALCQDITVSLGPDGIVIIEAIDIDNGSSSQCGGLMFEVDQDTFDCEDLGTNIVILTVTDETGASSTCTATVTVIDDLDPICSAGDLTVFLDADGNVSITAEQIDNGSTDNCEIDTLTVTPSEFTCDDLGDNIVTLTVTDQSGNSSTCTAIVTVSDTISPFCSTQDITVSIDINGFAVIEANDINDGSTDNCDIITLEVVPDTLDCENLGPNIVVLIVTDGSGNSSTCTATVTVELTPPMAVCQDITVSVGANGVVVIEPEEVDGGSGSNCGDLELTLSEDTFDCTELGLNIVILTVTDESGSSSTCTATVTVTDEIDPLCSTQDITVFVDATGNVTITATQIDDGSEDNCEIDTITVAPDEFTCADLGDNVVTLTVTDESGNSSTCTATVTVEDNIDPLCNAQDITVSINGSGEVVILPEQVDDGSSDNCGPVTLDVDPDTFDCDHLGPNEVVLTVTDGSGNSSTCTAIVTVTENNSLEAICQNITIFVDSDGNVSIDPEDVDNGSGGGCTIDTLTFDLSQTDFNCSDLGGNVVTLTVTDEEGNTATCTAIVTVVDNIPPSIMCPPNVTVNCDEVTNPTQTSQFGNATAMDNCPGVTIQEFAVFNLNDCNVGTITRTFVATDASGNTASCVQVVTIINPNPFTEDDITWPPSPVTVNICNSTDPEDLPNGEPTFDPQSLQCANPVATYQDQVQTIIDNNPNTPCKIITRTWTVTDNCQPNGTFIFVQTINVVDMVPPLFTNINDMTKVANEDCVAFFTLIASATDCAGVTITNNSPYGATTGANASGNYPIGVTVVIFTATDGCGNISTMDVVITVTDNDPTDFMCEKVVIILPEELEITLNGEIFVTFIPGNCTNGDDFIISYSSTNPFDTLRTYDCGDVGVTTFSLWFWNLAGTEKVDSCETADLDLRDPDDLCMDGLVLFGNVESEEGLPAIGVEVSILNAPMVPGTTNGHGHYFIEGLNEGVGYEVAPFNDKNHREGVSTLDLVMIQKHLLGRAKLNSPYKMIAADVNKSGHLSAVDLLETRKVILGVYTRFPDNTSWRFVDRNYSFIDPYLPFNEDFPESIWIDSLTIETDTADFIAVKVGDVNGSYFHNVHAAPTILNRNANDLELKVYKPLSDDRTGKMIRILAGDGFQVDGFQVSLHVGDLTVEQINAITTEFLTADQWYYDVSAGDLRISWSTGTTEDLTGKVIIELPASKTSMSEPIEIETNGLQAEAYRVEDESVEIRKLRLANVEEGVVEEPAGNEYHLFQNKPNPFKDGTVISFSLPQQENIRLVIYDLTGKQVFEHKAEYPAGRNAVTLKGDELDVSGIYYYTLYTANASFTRKMSFTNN